MAAHNEAILYCSQGLELNFGQKNQLILYDRANI